MDKYPINTPITASESGIAIIEFSENPPLLEQTIETIKIDDVIVAGTDFFLMPKYNGIKLIQEAVHA